MLGWRDTCRLLASSAISLLLVFQPVLMVEAAAPVVYDFRLVQATISLPSVKLYADIIGAGDVPVKGLTREHFKTVLGTQEAKLVSVAPFEDSQEGIGFILLVDVSKSLTRAQFASMKETLGAFVGAMSEKDRVALMTFGEKVNLLQDFTANRAQMREKISRLELTDDETAFYSGVDQALTLARAAGEEVPRRRVIISLTDGVNEIAGGVTKVDLAEKLAKDPVSLYLIGFVPGRTTPEQESAIGVMRNFSRDSGGRYYDGRGGDWRGIYFAISRAIRNSFVLNFEVPGFRSEGAVLPLVVTLNAANRSWSEKLTLTVPAGGSAPEATAGKPKVPADKGEAKAAETAAKKTPWLWIGGLLALVLLVGVAFFYYSKRSKNPQKAVGLHESPVSDDQKVLLLNQAMTLPAAETGVWIRLSRTDPEATGEVFELEIVDKVIIGSDAGQSHLVFDPASGMAPAHCELSLEQGLLWLKERDVSAVIYLNGQKLTGRQPLDENDVLQLGRIELKISFSV